MPLQGAMQGCQVVRTLTHAVHLRPCLLLSPLVPQLLCIILLLPQLHGWMFNACTRINLPRQELGGMGLHETKCRHLSYTLPVGQAPSFTTTAANLCSHESTNLLMAVMGRSAHACLATLL